jgi:hypothetical protein
MSIILFASLIFVCTGVQIDHDVISAPPEDFDQDGLVDLTQNSPIDTIPSDLEDVEPHSENLNLPDYMMDMMQELPIQAAIDRNITKDNDLWDMKSLVSIMTKGDVKLTEFIIKKIGELRTKTWAQRTIIQKRLETKKIAKAGAGKRMKDGEEEAITAGGIYKQTLKDSRYETAQINRDVQSYDRIMAKLNSMSDWPTCKSGWSQYGRSCYKVLARAYSYLQEYNCLKAGGSLCRVDADDDKKAIAALKAKDSHLQLGFFRSLRTGNWEYLDGVSVNPAQWYTWAGSNQNNRVYNYAGYYRGNNKLYPLSQGSKWGALCEHRLQVNLRK